MPQGNFEILHALKCVLGAPEALFVHAHSTYIPASCLLQLGFRSKSKMYGALAILPCKIIVHYLRQQHKTQVPPTGGGNRGSLPCKGGGGAQTVPDLFK